MSQHPEINTTGMLFYGQIKAGKLNLFDLPKFRQYCERQKEGLVAVEIVKKKKKRSLNENSYYWGVVVKILADEFGYFPEQMHEALKFEHLGVKDERGLTIVKSTANLSTDEFEAYLRKIRLWASSEHNIIIPKPDSPTAWNVMNNNKNT